MSLHRQGRRVWLDVPFSEKDEAKVLGARWDPEARNWYAPRPGMPGLARWERLPEVLPGEDRNFGSDLFVDLIPETSWFRNVRSAVDPADWHRLRTMVYGRVGQRCEICGSPANKPGGTWLEAHERFSYNNATRVQALRRLICLCTHCHTATHFGLARLKGKSGQAMAHLEAVTGMTHAQAVEHIDQAFTLWQSRSAVTWTLDLSMITKAGITIREPEPASAENWPPRFPDPPSSDGHSVTITPGY
jgi:hypothetical protein